MPRYIEWVEIMTEYFSKPIIILFIVFIKDKNVPPLFEKGERRTDLMFSMQPLSCGIQLESTTYKENINDQKMFYNIPGQNDGLSNLTSCVTLIWDAK